MKKLGNFLKSLRFRIFLMILVIGIIAIFTLRGAYLTSYRQQILQKAGFDVSEEGSSAATDAEESVMSEEEAKQSLRLMRHWTMGVALLMTAAIVAVSFFVATKMTKPLKRLIRSINDVQDGFEDDFEPVVTYLETARISDACDAMLQRLQILDKTQRQFVSDVSHELKTPLTSMKVLADSLIGQEDVPVELYREFMEDIGAEIDRESAIIDDLLSLVRTEKTSAKLNFTTVRLDRMLEQIIRRMKPLAQSREVELISEGFYPVTAEIDAVKLTQAVMNLVENAIKYNDPGGWVRVALTEDNQSASVIVSDNGIGIPEDAQEHIFERFYRADKSRSAEISGTGLGLSLARNVAILHHGSIRVSSTPGEGAEFTLRIPLDQSQEENRLILL